MYAGLSILFFFLVLFLQQVAGLERAAGRAGDAADDAWSCSSCRGTAAAWPTASGRACSWAAGRSSPPRGCCCMQRVGADPDYLTDLLPALLRLRDRAVADRRAADGDGPRRRRRAATRASRPGVNNAIARVAGLLGVAAIGAVVAAQFSSALDDRLAGQRLSPPAQAAVAQARDRTLARVAPANVPARERAILAEATEAASVAAFHVGLGIAAVLVAGGGVLGLVGIATRAATCAPPSARAASSRARRPRRRRPARPLAGRRPRPRGPAGARGP